MKNNDLFSSGYGSPFGGPNPDVHIKDGFMAKLAAILRFALFMSVEDLVKRVKSLWQVFYAKAISRLGNRIVELQQHKARTLREAEAIQQQLDTNEIPKQLSGRTSFEPPLGFWARLVFYVFLGIALITPILEWINFGWYLRFFTQSFLLGLAFAVPVLFAPFAEGAYLLILKPSERTRKLLATAQFLGFLISSLAYLLLCLISSDRSIASAFREDKSVLSVDSMRIAAQLLASVSISTLCLHAAFALGALTPTINKLRKVAEELVKRLHRDVATTSEQIAEVQGDLDEANAVREDAILACTHRHEHITTVNERTSQIMKEQL